MSMSLHLSHAGNSQQVPLSMADLRGLNVLLTGQSNKAVGVLMGAQDEDEFGKPRTVPAAELRAAVAELMNIVSPPVPTSGGHAYSFLVTFPGQRPFEVEGLAKLKIGGGDCDIDGGFERCELRTVRREGGRITVVSTRDLRGEKALRTDDGTEITIKRRRKKKPDSHLGQTLSQIGAFLNGVPDAEPVTVLLG